MESREGYKRCPIEKAKVIKNGTRINIRTTNSVFDEKRECGGCMCHLCRYYNFVVSVLPKYTKAKAPLFYSPTPWEMIQWTFFSYLEKESCVENWFFHVGLANWIELPHLMLQVRGSNPAQFENTTFLPQTPRGSQRSRLHRRISKLIEGGGMKLKKKENWNSKQIYLKFGLSKKTM